jgi:NADH-quinone oxidoreductase subunit F
LLPALHAAQTIYGWLPEDVADEVARSLHVPLADVHGVIEFYSLFSNEPLGKKVIRVCTDQACALKDARGILDHLCFHHGIQPGETTAGQAVTVEASPCLGLCELAPAVWTMDNGRWTVGIGSVEADRPRSMVYGPIRLLT